MLCVRASTDTHCMALRPRSSWSSSCEERALAMTGRLSSPNLRVRVFWSWCAEASAVEMPDAMLFADSLAAQPETATSLTRTHGLKCLYERDGQREKHIQNEG